MNEKLIKVSEAKAFLQAIIEETKRCFDVSESNPSYELELEKHNSYIEGIEDSIQKLDFVPEYKK